MTARISGSDLGDLLKEGEAIHAGHVDVREDHIDVFMSGKALEGFVPVMGENEFVLTLADVPTHSLKHEGFEVGFVVYNEDFVWRFHVKIADFLSGHEWACGVERPDPGIPRLGWERRPVLGVNC